MNRTVLYLAASVLLFFMAPGPGLAADLSGQQPPGPFGVFSTYSAESPKGGTSVVALSVEKAGSPDYWRYSSQLALGITNWLEFGANIPYVDNNDDTLDGIEDIAVTLKHRFFDEGRYGPSLAYVLTGSFASSNDYLSTEGRWGGGAIMSKRLGPLTGHVNAFYTVPWDKNLEEEVRTSVGFDFSAAHDFKILAELYVVKSHFSEKVDQREARFGYRFRYGNDIYSTLGVGIGLDDEDTTPEYRIMVSMSLFFPRTPRPPRTFFDEAE